MRRLTGRRILVCGGASGIGAATARLAATEGGQVWVHYRTRAAEAVSLCKTIEADGGTATAIAADLTSEADVARMVETIGDVHGCVHAVSPPLPRHSFDTTAWPVYQQHWDASVKALWLLATRLTASSPSLDSIAAVLSGGMFGTPPRDMAAYLSAKHALFGLCRSLAVELAPRRIRVNCVSPGLTPTPLTSHVDPRHHEILGRAVPLGRLATVDDAASALVFLLSPESAFITGVNLPVTGGAPMA